MHEQSLVADLLGKAEAVVRASGAARAARVTVRLGALSHLSADHLKEHFGRCSAGSPLEGAVLDIDVVADLSDPHAQNVILTSVDVVEEA